MFNRPKNEGKCNYCGHKLEHRTDDNTGTMKNRLEDFRNSTLPVIEYYRAQGNLIEINSDDYPKEVWRKIEKKLKEIGKLKDYEENFYSRTWKKFKNLF